MRIPEIIIIQNKKKNVSFSIKRKGQFTGYTVETTDFVHALKANDDFVKHRYGSANKASVAALRNNGESITNFVFLPLSIQFSLLLTAEPLTFDRCSNEGYQILAA